MKIFQVIPVNIIRMFESGWMETITLYTSFEITDGDYHYPCINGKHKNYAKN